MSSPLASSIPRRLFRRISGAVATSAACLTLAGCPYGFQGGTLPNVKTVAILPFDNDTPEPALTQEVSNAVRQALEDRLGLRDVEIINQREGTSVWKRQGLAVDGDYDPPNERVGRKAALDKLVQQIVDGAQSQW